MANVQALTSFATVDALHVAPSQLLLPPTPLRGAAGMVAQAGRSETAGHVFDFPAFAENVLFFQFADRMRLQIGIDGVQASTESVRGDVTIIPRGQHTRWCTAGAATTLILTLPNAVIEHTALLAAGVDGSRCELRPRVGCDDPLAFALGEAIYDHLHDGGVMGDLYLDTLLQALTVHLLHRHAILPPKVARTDGRLSPEALRLVTEFVEAHLDQPLTLTELAAVAKYSPYHLARCFRNTTGQPLHKYVVARRLERAKHLLTTTALGIAEIAHQTGFADHSHLTSHFRRAYRVTPAQYRAQLRRVPHNPGSPLL